MKVKEKLTAYVNLLASAITILLAVLPSDFPYKYRCIVLVVLIFYFVVESMLIKLVQNYKVTLIPPLLIIVAATIFWQYRPITAKGETIVFRNCGELFLDGEVISVEMIENINKLHKLRVLRFDGCIFEEGAFSELTLPSSIKSFFVSECSGISNFECISGASSLRVLVLEACGISDLNFPNLTATQLDQLSVAGNPDFSDLSCFPNAHLNYINISSTAVSDLGPLARYESLEEVIANNTYVTDLKPLSTLTCLKSLSFDNCHLSSVTEDFMSLRMESLSFANNRLSNCVGFQNFTQLKYVNLNSNNLKDISWLSKSSETLQQVYLGQNPLHSMDLGFLGSNKEMLALDIHGIQINSLEVLRNMERLHMLDVRHCGLTDISAIRALAITHIYLGGNAVQDLSPLHPSAELNRYSLLDLSQTKLHGLQIEKIRGGVIILDYFDGLPEQMVEFEKIYILNCPIDQRVKVEDKNSSSEVFYIESVDVPQMVENFKLGNQFYARKKSVFDSSDDMLYQQFSDE